MGLLLREALRRLCAEIGWSYAVFWNAICCGNSKHLVWAEGHHEPIRVSRHSLKECGVFRATGGDPHPLAALTCKEEDRVGELVNRMRLQVHIVGDGVVGRAAVTGNHQWIIQTGEGYNSEGLDEMNHQFFVGIRTIAVIPVLPHGIVQLGSIQMIMENASLIECVRELFLQLGCVPGALLSDGVPKDLDLKNEVSILGLHPSLNQSVTACSNLSNVLSCNSENFFPQINKIPMASPFTQSSCMPGKPLFSKEPLNSKPATTVGGTSICSQSDQAAVSSILHSNGLLEGQSVLSNADVQLQQTQMHDSSYRNHSQHSVVGSSLSYSSLSYLEGQVYPNAGQQKFLNCLPTSNSIESIQLQPHGKTISSSLKDSMLLVGREELSNNGNHFGISGLLPCTTESHTIGIQNRNSYSVAAAQVVSTNHSSGNCASAEATRSTMDKHTENMSIVTLSNIGNNLFQAIETPYSKISTLCSGPSSYGFQDCWMDSSNPSQSTQGGKNIVFAGRNTCTSTNGQEGNCDYKSLNVAGKCAADECIPRFSGDDLFDVLGIDFSSMDCSGGLHTFAANGNGLTTGESGTDLSTCIGQLEVDPVFDATHDGISSCSGIFSERGPDQLLDAVVSKINSGRKPISDDDVYCKTVIGETGNSLIHVSPSECGWASLQQQMHGEHFGLLPPVLKADATSSSVISAGSVDKSGECTQKDVVYKNQISLWVENGQNMKIESMLSAPCKRIDEVGKANRKRPRPGESPRPRPKDRQMIQDRVKELREIVPNGAKCSIDALLERTIKHMLFLQCVTKHADKLKETGEPKIISKEGGLLLKDNFEGGATWAFEVGTRSMFCPIIVEDLNPPRQLLVEMLCKERGFFLEIADLIRGLGLTILKGVMEARNDKVWARFAVEANRDVTRVDIFMSLVRLLEPTAGGSVAAQGFNSSNIPCNMVCQPSIPATGFANHLQ